MCFFFDFLISDLKIPKSIVVYMKSVTSTRLKIHQTRRSPNDFILDFKVGVGRNLIFGSVSTQNARFSCCSIVVAWPRGRTWL